MYGEAVQGRDSYTADQRTVELQRTVHVVYSGVQRTRIHLHTYSVGAILLTVRQHTRLDRRCPDP